jgi:glutathione synthase
MRIAFVVNRIETEEFVYSTTRLAMTAVNMGHEVWILSVSDFVYDPGGSILAHARSTPAKKTSYRSSKSFLADIQKNDARSERISVDDIDVLLLRNDPAEDAGERPWAQTSGILFGQLAVSRGVIVLNDPANLANALNKTYFQHFPDKVRPKTCISRDVADIKAFVESQGGSAVIKPLQGSGGQSVFLVRPDDKPNLNQMIEAVTRDGYAIVQEYLPAAAEGDTRLFVMNGQPLTHEGKIAALRRISKKGDMRSTLHAGGAIRKAVVDDQALELVELVRAKLVCDGMFLVGLDIVKDKLMEINVFSPGGLGSAQKLLDVDFSEAVIASLERKVQYKRYYGAEIDNVHIATL